MNAATLGFARNTCTRCGWRFFTSSGLYEHSRECGRPTPRVFSDPGLASLKTNGQRIAMENNARRFRCDECGRESTPGGIGLHQTYSGHVGRTELALT